MPPGRATARRPTGVRRALPDYESEPADRGERFDRADEIQAAPDDALAGHPRLCGTGRRSDDGGPVVVVHATCRPRPRRDVPDGRGGAGIALDQTACPEVQLN